MTLPRAFALKMVAPWMVGFAGLIAIPLLYLIALSFHEYKGASEKEAQFVGGQHYRTALGLPAATESVNGLRGASTFGANQPTGDARFRKSFANSVVYTAVAVPLGLFISLATAVLLHQPFRGVSVVRSIIYLPQLLGGVATIVIWSWLLNPRFGWVNQVIRGIYALLSPVARVFGFDDLDRAPVPDWLYSPTACKPAVILMSIWAMGGAMLIFLAALHRVPRDQVEAAVLDGASPLARFRNIVWPHLTPVVLFNLVMSTLFSMQSFNEAYFLQNRMQNDGLLFYALYVYEVAFEPPYRMGYAAALSCLMIVIMALMIGFIVATSRWWVHYAEVDR